MRVFFGGVVLVAVALGSTGPAAAQTSTAVKPYFVVMVDTSSSMTATTPGAGPNSCGQPRTRINDAKCVFSNIVNSYGDVVFGLGSFNHPSCTISGSVCNWSGSACTAPQGGAQNARILEPVVEDNQAQLLEWVNFFCATCNYAGTDPEIDAGSGTPLASSLRRARVYYQGTDATFGSPIAGDAYAGCRPYYVILLTDGNESCSTAADPPAAATELRTTSFGGSTYDIRTFVIGFDTASPDPNVESIAVAGGTNAPGPNAAFYANDETTLSVAFSTIIGGSVLVEMCDGVDNNCDGVVDEGFPVGDPCDGPDADLCPEGVFVCNAAGDGVTCTDTTGTDLEVCNGADDDCDGLVDEPPADCSGCVPQPEICNGVDDDCDGLIDEGITRPCGINVGVCTSGTQDCIELSMPAASGTWGPCSGAPPSPESCDGLDNDCDGVVDGIIDACGNPPVGQCQPGTTLCTDGMWGPCIGEIGPGMEGCDGIDNDCDGTIDDGNPGGGAPCGTMCGVGITECIGGMLVCTGGGMGMPEVCNGLDDDCDGMIDEGLPDMGPCDEMGTLCMPGTLQCVGGEYMCIGGSLPEPEICDCMDNDCDAEVDEGPLCASGATCLGAPYCQCAQPCADDEFQCAAGRICTNPADPLNGYCVNDPCYMVTCPPDAMTGDPTKCVDGMCVPLCTGVTCGSPLVCRASDGACVEDNCNGFPDRCADGELCVDGVCEADPCAGVTCPSPTQYCYMGTCVESCAGVTCPPGQSCELGVCVSDACAGVSCPGGQVCDPTSGMCVSNRCFGRTCPPGERCDPTTGECVRDECLGVECPTEEEVCFEGSCYDPDQGPGRPDAGPNTYVTAAGGGCGCRAGERGAGAGNGAIAFAILVVLAAIARTKGARGS